MSGSRVYFRALTAHDFKIWVTFNFVSISFNVPHLWLRERLGALSRASPTWPLLVLHFWWYFACESAQLLSFFTFPLSAWDS